MEFSPVEQFDYDTVQPVIFSRYDHRTKSKRKWSDNILVFDIETANVYRWPDGSVTGFDYSLPPEAYQETNKFGFMVCWQFAVDGDLILGRTWDQFYSFLAQLRARIGADLIIYVHNLGFEFQYMRNVIDDFEVFARESRRPMKAISPSLGVEFRCSQMLTNAKLEDVPGLFHLDVTKAVGSWDYDKLRTPETPLTDAEIDYAFRDVIVPTELIRAMLEQYKHVERIPLTNTSRLRREINDVYNKVFWTKRKIADMNTTDPAMFWRMKECFSGGYTHANAANAGRILKNVASADEASSYPAQMVGRRFPWGQFQKSNAAAVEDLNPDFAYMLHLRLTNVTSRFENHYISFSKCMKRRGTYCDNGRIIMADMIELWCTDLDFDIIRRAYLIGKIEILDAYTAPYRYLDQTYVKIILDYYGQKTALKKVKGREREYAEAKVKINSAYGMMVTDTIRDEVVFEDNEWKDDRRLTYSEIVEALEKAKNPRKCFLSFAFGVWVTAWARKALWEIIMAPGCDKAIVYCDTDSVKYDVEASAGAVEKAIAEYNKKITAELDFAMIWQQLDPELTRPKDPKGNPHQLGVFESEGVYDEFITIGAKKYAVRVGSEIETTIAGVGKTYVDTDGRRKVFLKSLDDFKIGFKWPYRYSGRTTAYYNDDQDAVRIGSYVFRDRFGVCVMPTEYTLGETDEYKTFMEIAASERDHNVCELLETRMVKYERNDEEETRIFE